jgi:hypothetical protein
MISMPAKHSEDAAITAMYCTILSTAFVPRALALQQSLAKYSPDALFAFYCVDDATAALLQKHASAKVRVVRLDECESDQLRVAKRNRTINEYRWTCKPAVLLHALASSPDLDWAVWLDADMLAFGDLTSELRRYPNASVILTPHRFSLPEFAIYEPTVGRFNAGYVAFRNSDDGSAALNWWMARCLEGCPAVPTDGRYGDQKYLNALPRDFAAVAASESQGLNCAPWNIFAKKVGVLNGSVTVDKSPLLLYHFQGLKIIRDWAFELYAARLRLPKAVREIIYAPYLAVLGPQIRDLAGELKEPLAGIDREFMGYRGLFKAAKRLRWSRNLVVRL